MTDVPSPEPTVELFGEILDRHVGEIRHIVELGARDCAESIAFAERYPDAHVYAFECNPETVPLCRQAIARHPNITLMPKAVTDIEGAISFFQFVKPEDENPGASSVYPFGERYPNETRSSQREVTVESTTLQRFMVEHELPSIDALWMDVQGAELAALRGLGRRLHDVRAILAEVAFGEIYAGQPLFWHVWWFLRRHGFLLYGFPMYSGWFADAVFINRRVLRRPNRPDQRRELRALWQTIGPLYLLARGKQP